MESPILNTSYANDVRPNISPGGHPIEQGDYLIDTISINDIADSILKWVNMRNPGAIIYGAPRLGKTYGVKYLKRFFDIKYQSQWETFIVEPRKMKTPNENRFFENFLRCVGHELYKNGKPDDKRDRLVNFLYDKGDQTLRNQIVLFIDEAERLTTLEYEWLMDVYNELDSNGITLTTILVGQTELKNRRNVYLKSAKQIVGRFMIHEEKFFGIRKKDELAYLLASYDNITEFPIDSNWTYKRFFFPYGFAQGLRLEQETGTIWGCIQKIRVEAGVKKKLEIPMHYMIAIINYVLMKYGANEEACEWPTESMWNEAIIETGYINAEVINGVD